MEHKSRVIFIKKAGNNYNQCYIDSFSNKLDREVLSNFIAICEKYIDLELTISTIQVFSDHENTYKELVDLEYKYFDFCDNWRFITNQNNEISEDQAIVGVFTTLVFILSCQKLKFDENQLVREADTKL